MVTRLSAGSRSRVLSEPLLVADLEVPSPSRRGRNVSIFALGRETDVPVLEALQFDLGMDISVERFRRSNPTTARRPPSAHCVEKGVFPLFF